MKKLLTWVSALFAGFVGMAQTAMASVDTTAVGTAITAAQTDGESIGSLVIAAVAGLAVIGVIIGVVHKLR